MEPHLRLVECFDAETNTCPITAACGLNAILYKAHQAFLHELDQVSLASLLQQPQQPQQLLRVLGRP